MTEYVYHPDAFFKSEFDLVCTMVLTFWTVQAPAFLVRMLYAAVCSVSAAYIKGVFICAYQLQFHCKNFNIFKKQIIIPNHILSYLFHLLFLYIFLYVTDLSEKILYTILYYIVLYYI